MCTVEVKLTTPGYNYPILVEFKISNYVTPTIQAGAPLQKIMTLIPERILPLTE
jgi:hypothetical protein